MASPDALEFRSVTKSYPREGGAPRHALNDVSFTVPQGSIVAIIGRSGSGKSTLLHLAAGIDSPTSGSVHLLGRDLALLSETERTRARRDLVGLVFQFFYLLPHLSVIENVLLPSWIAGEGKGAAAPERAGALLRRVGLADRAADPVRKLSGGEMQRVAICRALLRRPRLLLADEPTGNLDDDTSRSVMDLLLEMAAAEGSTVIYVTHSRELAARAGRIHRLHSGRMDLAQPGSPEQGLA